MAAAGRARRHRSDAAPRRRDHRVRGVPTGVEALGRPGIKGSGLPSSVHIGYPRSADRSEPLQSNDFLPRGYLCPGCGGTTVRAEWLFDGQQCVWEETLVNKAELIEALSGRLGDRKSATAALDAVLAEIQSAVTKGDKVSITGFGVFEKRVRAARTARNPRTGESVKVKKTSVPAFRPGTGFKELVAAGKLPKAVAPAKSAAVKTTAVKTAAAKTAAVKAAPAKTVAAKPVATKTVAAKPVATRTVATKTAAAKPATATTTARKTVASAAKAAPAPVAAKPAKTVKS